MSQNVCSLRSLLKISYTACCGLSPLVSAQFALEMCLKTPKSGKNVKKNPYFSALGANWKPVYNFQLVINTNLGSISHHSWDVVTYQPKIAIFSYLSLIWHSCSGCPLSNFWKSLQILKLESSRQLYGEDLVILACTVLTDPLVWQTDRQAELRWLRCATAVPAFACKNGTTTTSTTITSTTITATATATTITITTITTVLCSGSGYPQPTAESASAAVQSGCRRGLQSGHVQ